MLKKYFFGGELNMKQKISQKLIIPIGGVIFFGI